MKHATQSNPGAGAPVDSDDLTVAIVLLRRLSRACANGAFAQVEDAVNAAVNWYREHRDTPTIVAALQVHGITTGADERR
jgi:hypothetical protein